MAFDLITFDSKQNLDIHPTALTLNCFAEIWNRDKSKNKEQALKELAFIYWMYNWNSSYYKGYPDDKERLIHVTETVFNKDKWKQDNIVNIACKEYQKLQELEYPGLSDLKTARKTLNSLKEFLDSLDPNERNKSEGLVLKPAEIYQAISKMSEALIAVDKMEKKIKEDLTLTDSKIKGGGKAGNFEDEEGLDYLKK